MYNMLPPNSIKPQGWLLEQLKIQANGLSGNLDKIWPDIADSAWIGGEHEGWERVPYWLDGFIPLAYLLDDADLKIRAEKYINAIISHQQADGWICPCPQDKRSEYDIWALFLLGKVFALYWEFTKSDKVLKSLYSSMKCYYEMLKSDKAELFDWGKFRWFECMIPLQLLNEQYNEEWVIEFGRILRSQGADYEKFTERWKRPLYKWTFETHIVNIGMMFKYEAVCCQLFGEKYSRKAEMLWDILEKYNGTATGVFTGDECLAGLKNNQGTELCSVAELMYSCELLYSITGDRIWADRLEKMAFNALPATISDDMWTHQYDQLSNQIACVKFGGKPIFGTNGREAHLFGLEPNYGCCTANFNQAWPKLAMSVFMKTDYGIECAMMLPAKLTTQIDGTDIAISIDTQYPFRHYAKYTVTVSNPIDFELKIRIPAWVKKLTVDGEEKPCQEYINLSKIWQGEQSFEIRLFDTPHFTERPFGLRTAQYGPLVFSLPIDTKYVKHEYEKNGVERKFPYCDYELFPESEWRYGFSGDTFTVCEKELSDVPFSSLSPALTLKTNMSRVDWNYADGYENVSAITPHSNYALDEGEEKELFPYGCAKLRMTEMPMTIKK